MSTEAQGWRRCSSCKEWIDFIQPHYVCSVSTCNRKRTGLVFCSVACWEVHVPMMRHRDSGAVEERAPTREAHARAEREAAAQASAPAAKREPKRTVVRRGPSASPEQASGTQSSQGAVPAAELSDDIPIEVLIVVSKLKQYVKARSGMNTSDAVMKMLSDHVRALCDKAIQSAVRNERKTLMDRDFSDP